eukprot:1721787-Amphidinium_carterae.1
MFQSEHSSIVTDWSGSHCNATTILHHLHRNTEPKKLRKCKLIQTPTSCQHRPNNTLRSLLTIAQLLPMAEKSRAVDGAGRGPVLEAYHGACPKTESRWS